MCVLCSEGGMESETCQLFHLFTDSREMDVGGPLSPPHPHRWGLLHRPSWMNSSMCTARRQKTRTQRAGCSSLDVLPPPLGRGLLSRPQWNPECQGRGDGGPCSCPPPPWCAREKTVTRKGRDDGDVLSHTATREPQPCCPQAGAAPPCPSAP